MNFFWEFTLVPLPPILSLCLSRCLPLHVTWLIRPTARQRLDMVNHVTWALTSNLPGQRAGMFNAECMFGGCTAMLAGRRIKWARQHNEDDRNILYRQIATPPWCEHVPRACLLKLYEPSRHWALDPGGAAPVLLLLGECTSCPSLFR